MRHRIGQPAISIVATGKVAESFPGTPVFQSSSWNRSPGKWVSAHGLVDSIYAHRVVCGRSSESIAVGRVGGNVNAAARIHEPSLAIHSETYAERVRMAMATAANALRTGIHHDLLGVRLRVCQDVESAVPERGRKRRGIPGLPCKAFDSLLSKQPNGFFRQARRRKIFAAVEQRSDSQWVGHVLGAIASRFENPAAVVVPKTFRRSSLREPLHHGKHFAQDGV